MAESVARWSSRERDALPGSLGNIEKPDSAWSLSISPGTAGPFVLLGKRVARRLRREVILEIRNDGVALGPVNRTQVIPWASIDSIDVDLRYPRSSAGPRVSIHTRAGEDVPIPAVLYPDAESDFPSKRHIDRARSIGIALDSALQAQRQE